MENIDKFIDKFFNEPAQEYIDNNIELIINTIKRNKYIELKSLFITLNDVVEKTKNKDHLTDKYLTIRDGKITLMYYSQKLQEEILRNTYEQVEELNLDDEFIENIEILKRFPNIKKLIIKNSKKLNNEFLEYIKNNTKIKKVEIEDYFDIKNINLDKDDYIITKPNKIIKKGDITISQKIKLGNYFPNFYEDELEIIIPNDNITYSKIKELYNMIPGKDKIKTIKILKQNEVKPNKICEIILDENKNIKDFSYNCEEGIEKAYKLYEEISREKRIENVKLKVKNKDYDKLYLLNAIDRNSNLSINYDDNFLVVCSLDEFKGMREALSWFTSNIKEASFSPLEKILYAYDMMKTFQYKENDGNRLLARDIHNIINTDYMVCVGFSKLLDQILKENDIPSTSISLKVMIDDKVYGHQRNIIRLDDDKYNIHGIFSLDATFDRNKYYKNKENEDVYVDEQYYNFLIPPIGYSKIYGNEIIPAIMKSHNKEQLKDNLDDESIKKQIIPLFGKDYDLTDITEYLNTPQIPRKAFQQAYETVKRYEGYIDKDIKTKQENTMELNEMLDTNNATLFKKTK